jgi:hypothetical protein
VKGRLKADSNYQCNKCSVNGTVGAAGGKKKNLLFENGESIERVEEFCYFGDVPGRDSGSCLQY